MDQRFGDHVSRHPVLWLCFWGILAFLTIFQAPSFESVWKDGEFAFLPGDVPSRRAEQLYRDAFLTKGGDTEESAPPADPEDKSFDQDPLGSSIVIVLERKDRPTGLTPADEDFIAFDLLPALEQIQATTPPGYYDLEYGPLTEKLPWEQQIVRDISSREDPRLGTLFTSEDLKATLIVLELKTEFLDRQNGLVVQRIENLLRSPKILECKPLGLSIALSGSATVGRDMLRAEKISASRTETFTKVLVIVLLMLIYRSPLLALVPLVTVGVAVELSQALLRILASWGWIELFTGLEVYVTVVVYGAGIDYCLFLIARYKEELDLGLMRSDAMSRSIHRVGIALATSAGTSIIGIAMMGFSDFGKFRQAGFAISFGLFVVLCFAVTFTPAFLLLFGKWVFWPNLRDRDPSKQAGWLPSTTIWGKLREARLLDKVWNAIADTLHKRPGTVFLITTLVMLPFATIGGVYQDDLSYGLLSDLPQDEPSVLGAEVVQNHYAAGITGPVTVLLEFEEQSLRDYLEKNENVSGRGDLLNNQNVAKRLSKEISDHLLSQKESLNLEDIRSQEYPLGVGELAREYEASLPLRSLGAKRVLAFRNYTSLHGDYAGRVMRMDLITRLDPFSREAIQQLSTQEQAIREAIPESLRENVRILPMGTTAGIRDLKSVTDHDRVLIDILVVTSVYLVIVLLLGRPRICAYLMVTVVFSYLVSLGVTYVVFYLRDPSGFTGIDWKVPIYLFTILIAMGEDYNILLMARIEEEQQTHGLVGGVLHALTKTGSIISSCGIIMAGTFCSLMSGELLGMVQLGFALAFGVMLDTFIVRPILVPAYLIMLYQGQFGVLGPWLGGPVQLESDNLMSVETDPRDQVD
ncbi:MAG: MMPL family transporter [Planctomycetaceae bacterium]|nr:MMPL family transporter [Planctomycetaceae bacterium]